MNLSAVLQYLFPGITVGEQGLADCSISVGADGVPRIEQWNRPEPQPTDAEIEAATPAAMEWWARKQIKPVTRRQMLTALHRAGLLDTIKAAVAASGDVELQIAYDESQEFQRDNQFLASMAQALGKSDTEVDAIFALAASL